MDSALFPIFIWTIIGIHYLILIWSLYLAINLKIETRIKIIVCVGITVLQPLGALIFAGWYFNKYKTFKRIR
jgi:hypothetical protein